MGSIVNSINSFGGMRNRLINGNMRIDQRNEGVSITPTSTNLYSTDRWRAVITQSSKYSVQRQSATPPTGFTNYLRATSLSAFTVAATDTFGINQFIEAFNVSDFNLGTVNAVTFTLSFWVRSSLTGTFGGSIRTGDSSNYSYPYSYSIPVANTWTFISVTIPGPTAGTWGTGNATGMDVWFSLGAGVNFQSAPGSWSAANLLAPTGETRLVATNGATLDVTGVQLEIGDTATPFERRLVGYEFILAQRYYEKSYDSGVALGTGSNPNGFATYRMGVTTSTTYRIGQTYKVIKRTTPTATFYSPNSGASGVVVIGVTDQAPSATGPSQTSIWAETTAANGNPVMSYHWAVDAEL